MKILINAFAVLFISVSAYAQKYTIALNLTRGLIYTQSTSANMKIAQEMKGQKVDIDMNVSGSMIYKVLNELGGMYDLEVSYQRLALKMNLPTGTLEFSTEKTDDKDIMSGMLRKMKDRPFLVRMTKTGRINEIRNIGKLFEGILDSVPKVSEVQKQQILAQLNQAYGENAFKGNLELLSAVFPESPVAVGDSWKVQTNLQAGLTAKIDATYKLADVTDSQFVINGISVIAPMEVNSNTPGVNPVKVSVSGSMEAILKIDKRSGWISEGNIRQDIKGNTTLPKSEKVPEEVVVPMQITSEMIIRGN